jgi:Cu-processing system ATP-binding protein
MIKVAKLSKSFGHFRALFDVSFEVKQGETFALLGPNGSGKSTALKCMAGLTVPTSGSISVLGADVWKERKKALKSLSFLPQRTTFPDSLSAREVMEFYCKLRRLPLVRIDQLLGNSEFEFDGFADRRVAEFSGGMTQRLGLAVACLPDTPLLLLDEPTVSLDPEGAVQFREFVKGLKRSGKTILFSSHMLEDVQQLADRVAILVNGKLVALQSIEELRREAGELTLEQIYIRCIHEKK